MANESTAENVHQTARIQELEETQDRLLKQLKRITDDRNRWFANSLLLNGKVQELQNLLLKK